MYTVKMNEGGRAREVPLGEGLELVAGKRAKWEPPLAKQMLREGDAVKERVEGEGGEAVTRVVPPATAGAAPPAKK
jgi:hypothetical protein